MTVYNPQSNPFPGLRPFESDEEHLFFGRDDQKDELLRRLRSTRFVAVLGTSGSGKSSLVRAGLLPSLYGGIMTRAGSGWRVALMRPGVTPIHNLASSLGYSTVLWTDLPSDADLQIAFGEATLRRTSLGLVELVRQLRMPPHENLLIVVDQFEEVFRFRARQDAEDDATAFVKLLLEAAAQQDVPIYVVLTMRADFLGEFAQFWELPQAHNVSLHVVPPMTREQYREAITGPIAVSGCRVAPTLVNRLLNDIGDSPEQLPIFQHTLMRTWDHWWAQRSDDEPLDLPHYLATGGMSNALSIHADEAFDELASARSREIAEKLFKTLTERGTDSREMRRPTRLREICEIVDANEEEVTAVIDTFRRSGRSFLMPPPDVALSGDTVIDISHESLMRNWRRLRDWVEQEMRSAQIFVRIAETALLFEKREAGLWHDPDLQVALGWRDLANPNRAWAERYHPGFESAMHFLEESKQAREESRAKLEHSRNRRMRLTRIVATALAAMALVSFSLLIYSNRLRSEAETQRRLAEAQRIDALKLKDEIEKQKNLIQQMMKEAETRARAAEAKAKANAAER